MKTTWIVVAESARARIFTLIDPGANLHERADLSHPESRMHDRELTSDLPGRAFDSHGQGRHSMEQGQDPKDQEAQAFAGEIAAEIANIQRDETMDALAIIAPPKFLGLLRAGLDKRARDLLVAEIDKNLVEADIKTLEKRLPELIREATS